MTPPPRRSALTVSGRWAKGALALVLGGGVGALCVKVVVPFMTEHSEIVLPFAVSNAAASAGWFAVAEAVFGMEALLGVSRRLPVVGAGVGLLTAVSSPVLWPSAFRLFWSEDLRQLVFNGEEHDWIAAVYRELFLPVAVPVSVLAGSTLEVVLRPLLRFSDKTRLAGPTALVAVYGSALAYFLLCSSDPEDFWWELRRSKHGELISVNAKSGKVEHDGGRRAEVAAEKRGVFENIHLAQAVVVALQELFGGGRPPRESPGPVTVFERADMSLRTIKERAELFSLIDALVRRKYLELEVQRAREQRRPSSELERELTEADSLIRRQFSVNSPSQLLADCELALSLIRGARGLETDAEELDRVLSRISSQQSGYFTSRSSINPQARHAMDLLLANLGMLEGELRRELGYSIAPTASSPTGGAAPPTKASYIPTIAWVAAGVGIGALLFVHMSGTR